MKKIFSLAVIIFLSLQLLAQSGSVSGGRNGQTMTPMAHIYGKLTDNLGKPVSAASVLLLKIRFDSASKKQKDLLVKAMVTKANGDFSFEDVPVSGALKFKISAVGYKTLEQPLSFFMNVNEVSASSLDKDLGNIKLGSIKLETDAKQLATVLVTANTSALKLDIDKKVFNVDKNIVSAGGTATDVMRNVPSVQVDIDGNVKLRNASPQIYVDGRPTTLSLDQIPAEAIQSVEVITNPSAKYDASGGNAGILNIVLKKNRKSGYNGNVMAGVDKRGGINAGGNFNIRQNKINLSAAVNINQMKNRSTGSTNRLNFGDTQTHVFQNNLNKTQGAFVFGKLGLDYYVTNRTTFTLAGIKVHGEFKPNEIIDITTDSLFNSGLKGSAYSQRLTNGSRTFNANGLQTGLIYNFPREGEQLTADGNFFSGKNNSNSLYTTSYYDGGNINGTQTQKILSGGSNKFLTLQTDYARPFDSTTKLETGLRAQLRNTVSNNDTYTGSSSGGFIKIPTGTSNYENHDNVYAAYVSVKSSVKTFGYQVGLRAESSNYNAELTNTGEKFSNKYPVSLFPSLFLSQKLSNKQQVQFSYTRRINRPNFFQLIPYTDYTDSLNITRGNPGLTPEFTTSLELSYSKTFKGNNNILGSIYYKHTNNLITRYLSPGTNPFTGKEDIINSFVNANSSYSYGAELTSVNNLTRWWDVTTNLNLYKSKINTDNITGTSQDAILSWFGKFNSNFKLPKNLAFQLSAMYQGKTNIPVNNNQGGPGGGGPFGQAQSSSQGYIRPFWGMDVAVRKSFLKNNAATVSLSFSDIFRTRKQDQHSESAYFIQDYYRLNNPQMIRLNISYRFGKMENLFKRQNTKSTGTQDATQLGGQ